MPTTSHSNQNSFSKFVAFHYATHYASVRAKLTLTMVFICALMLASSAAYAGEDAAYYKRIRSEVLPYVNANLKHARVKAYDGIELNYALLRVENSKGTIFLSPGRSESILSQSELIYDLAKAGYSVAAIDHRGQGFSQRLLKSDAGHVVNFRDYVKDFKTFATSVVQARMPKPYYFLGSSMGAAIGTHFAIVNPTFFKRMAAAAPMYQISNGLTSSLIYETAKALTHWGWGDTLAPSQRPYDFDRQFQKNLVTHSMERFKLDVWLTKKNPAIAVGGPTTNWVLEASKESQFLRRHADKLQTPIVVIQAGADSVVGNQAQRQVCMKARDCTMYVVAGALHSIFFEIDVYRSQALNHALEFFNE